MWRNAKEFPQIIPHLKFINEWLLARYHQLKFAFIRIVPYPSVIFSASMFSLGCNMVLNCQKDNLVVSEGDYFLILLGQVFLIALWHMVLHSIKI